jgi:hypothetical protein
LEGQQENQVGEKEKVKRAKSVKIMPHTLLVHGGDAETLRWLPWKQVSAHCTELHAPSNSDKYHSRVSTFVFFK